MLARFICCLFMLAFTADVFAHPSNLPRLSDDSKLGQVQKLSSPAQKLGSPVQKSQSSRRTDGLFGGIRKARAERRAQRGL